MSSRAETIKRHLDSLSGRHGPEVLDQLLDKAGLRRDGDTIVCRGGGEIDDAVCNRYLVAVGETLGETTARFSRANFVLAGCVLDDD